jgi:uncharacterized protein
VDIGVHQDGLVHISAMSEQFVKDPHSVVKAGDLVKVKVLEVDLERKRIALTMRLAERAEARPAGEPGKTRPRPGAQPGGRRPAPAPTPPPAGGTMADALQRALKGRR